MKSVSDPAASPEDATRTAAIYRMVMEDHLCPFGLKAKDLLERRGFDVHDHPLRSRQETEDFKAEHHVDETPQVFIGGRRIGGYEALRDYLGHARRDTTYQPVIAVFAVALLMALAAAVAAFGTVLSVRTVEWFVAFSMCILAILKLRDLESFSLRFLGYDLLARRNVPYATMYPFAEAAAGVLMIADRLIVVASFLALFIGSIGAVSVFKAVYIDKRDLKCACVGGGSKVPLGPVSLAENVMMVLMGLWMILK